ncbi:MAG: hypothetical protein Q4E70_03105 [Candidatus Saccharibacteria bacterium]|nr:hypothetical protein [Candidatus Saccharibacteria bacterium]
MRNGTYTAKRRASAQEWRGNSSRSYGDFGAFSTGFSRNRNTVRFSGNGRIGKFALIGVFFMLLLNLGLIYVDQSAKATGYDYQLSGLNAEIDDLEARKEDLAVEKARLTSIANSNNSAVAARMESATAEGTAE